MSAFDADLIAVTAFQILADAKGLERLYERSPNARRGNDPERLRNTAHLIAAAPELYEALFALTDEVGAIVAFDADESLQTKLRFARAALLKASPSTEGQL